MVESIKSIIARYPKQSKTDLNIILEYLGSNPDSQEALLLLKNYPVDFFHAELWDKSIVLSTYYAGLGSKPALEPVTIIRKNTPEKKMKEIDTFLAMDIPDFLKN